LIYQQDEKGLSPLLDIWGERAYLQIYGSARSSALSSIPSFDSDGFFALIFQESPPRVVIRFRRAALNCGEENPIDSQSQSVVASAAVFLAVISMEAFEGTRCSPFFPPLWWLPLPIVFAALLCSRLVSAFRVSWFDIPVDPHILVAAACGFMIRGLSLELVDFMHSLRRTLP
jgi:hypothetical protein